jgi:hypothetical protein
VVFWNADADRPVEFRDFEQWLQNDRQTATRFGTLALLGGI